jgi:hypothetical protein
MLHPASVRRPPSGLPVFAVLSCLAVGPAWPIATTDCFADRIVSFTVGPVGSPPAFNTWQPGMVLGPPGNATPTTGSLAVMSLGRGGEIVLELSDNEIVDGPGPDFILFENPFFCSSVPQADGDPYSVFAEPGIVAVSADGIDFRVFPYDSGALAEVVSQCSDKTLVRRLAGLMGITPSFNGNYTVPDDPLVFDPSAPGGVSGHGGDAFDLAAVGLSSARFVRITDPDLGISLPGSSEGLDLDTVVAIRSRPRLGPGHLDTDGDGLSDVAEDAIYMTDPLLPDSDADGAPDGEEAASCRSPLASGGDPFFAPVIDLEIPETSPTVARWSFLGSGVTYDVIRGEVRSLRSSGGIVDLGLVVCIENDSTDLTTRGLGDTAVPAPGEAFFYAVRQNPPGSGLGYGLSSAGGPRRAAAGDCL